ncbi:hypothetical protein CEF21_10830 [Bacillus sp. FJAT-42376]|uniref:hypothetical protein n=1 Tax=Bacillus sp. FJAT-42376 TaxID=2014076 RepID=UPI000F4E014F|nr:hypothetical protein [Bacillus sp. FJAT-42376]AZB42747.1 hypothetical protein CEF21_10830 [Bacillus sp. FJAT-42376]
MSHTNPQMEIVIRVNELLDLSSRLKEREQDLLDIEQGFTHSYFKASSHYPQIEQTEISYHAESIRIQLAKLTETMAHLAEITRMTPAKLNSADQQSAEQITHS